MAGLSYSRLQMRDSADYYLRLAVDSSLAKDIKWYAHHFARNYADFLYDFNPKASISYLRLLKERYPEREILGSYVMLDQSWGAGFCPEVYREEYVRLGA